MKIDIKHWRKELGRERKLKIKLERKLENKELKIASETKEPNIIQTIFHKRTTTYGDNIIASVEASSIYAATDTDWHPSDNINTENLVAATENPSDEFIDETCSICARPIKNYAPKYFQDLLINPACSECDDSTEETDDDTPG